MKKQRNWAPFLLILPSVIYLALFFAWPMFRALTLSVWDDDAVLRLNEEPSAQSAYAGSLPRGALVAIVDRQGNMAAAEELAQSNVKTETWYRVRGAEGAGQAIEGWAPETRVRVREQDESGRATGGHDPAQAGQRRRPADRRLRRAVAGGAGHG